MAVATSIFDLVALGAAPASNDVLVIVDVSDTTQSPQGSTKKILVSDLFTSVTITTSLTVTGTATISSTLNVAGNFSVATNKLTVAAASGNTAIAGTLGVTGDVAVNTNKFTVAASSGNTVVAGTLAVNGGTATIVGSAADSTMAISSSGGSGRNYQWVSKTDGRLLLLDATAGIARIEVSTAGAIQLNSAGLTVLAGGATVTGNSTITGTLTALTGITSSGTAAFATSTASVSYTGARVIGGTDIPSAVAVGVFSDATPLGGTDIGVAGVLGVLSNYATTSASGSKAGANFAAKQTAASSGALTAARGFVWAAHTSGTLASAFGLHGSGQFDGNGGTTTSADMVRAGNFSVGSGHTVTTLRGAHVTTGSNSGTITNQVGVDIDNMALGATLNYAIRTQANCSLFNGSGSAIATNATVGFVHIPSCAGTPTGVPANLVTGACPMIFDTTGVKLWIYAGSWKGVVVA